MLFVNLTCSRTGSFSLSTLNFSPNIPHETFTKTSLSMANMASLSSYYISQQHNCYHTASQRSTCHPAVVASGKVKRVKESRPLGANSLQSFHLRANCISDSILKYTFTATLRPLVLWLNKGFHDTNVNLLNTVILQLHMLCFSTESLIFCQAVYCRILWQVGQLFSQLFFHTGAAKQ